VVWVAVVEVWVISKHRLLSFFLCSLFVQAFAQPSAVPHLQYEKVLEGAQHYETLLRNDAKVKRVAYVAGIAAVLGAAYGGYHWLNNEDSKEKSSDSGALKKAAKIVVDPDWHNAKQYFKTLFVGALASGCALFVLKLMDKELSSIWTVIKKRILPREFLLQMSFQRVSVGVKRLEHMMFARHDMAHFADLRTELAETYAWLLEGMEILLSLLVAKATLKSKECADQVKFRIRNLLGYVNYCGERIEESLQKENTEPPSLEITRLLDYIQGELAFVIEESCGEG
jgi:hypothetical protein